MTLSTIRLMDRDMARLDDIHLLALFHSGHVRARMLLHHRHAYMAQRMARHLRVGDPEQVTAHAIAMAIEAEPSVVDGPASFRDRLFAAIRHLAEQTTEKPADVFGSSTFAAREARRQSAPDRRPVHEIMWRAAKGPIEPAGAEHSCEDIRAALPGLQAHTLDRSEREQVHAHLRSCSGCLLTHLTCHAEGNNASPNR